MTQHAFHAVVAVSRQSPLDPAIALSQGRRAGRTLECLHGPTAAGAPVCRLACLGGGAGARRCVHAVAAEPPWARFVALVADLFGNETDVAGQRGRDRLARRRSASGLLRAVRLRHRGIARAALSWRDGAGVGPIAAHCTRVRRGNEVLARMGPRAVARAALACLADPLRLCASRLPRRFGEGSLHTRDSSPVAVTSTHACADVPRPNGSIRSSP